jgi:hypothetical protein
MKEARARDKKKNTVGKKFSNGKMKKKREENNFETKFDGKITWIRKGSSNLKSDVETWPQNATN